MTINAKITLKLQSSPVEADLKSSLVNGKTYTDFPVTLKNIPRRSVDGRIGQGDVNISLNTVNGSIKSIK